MTVYETPQANTIATIVADRCQGNRRPGRAPERYAIIWQAARLGAIEAGAATADLQARLDTSGSLLRQCLKWLPLLDSHEAGSTTDLLCDSISEHLATARNTEGNEA